jgi:hypothetical protein
MHTHLVEEHTASMFDRWSPIRDLGLPLIAVQSRAMDEHDA